MSYVLKQTTTIFYIIHKTITFTRGPSLTTLGTPCPMRPHAMGWAGHSYKTLILTTTIFFTLFYDIAQYTLCPAEP